MVVQYNPRRSALSETLRPACLNYLSSSFWCFSRPSWPCPHVQTQCCPVYASFLICCHSCRTNSPRVNTVHIRVQPHYTHFHSFEVALAWDGPQHNFKINLTFWQQAVHLEKQRGARSQHHVVQNQVKQWQKKKYISKSGRQQYCNQTTLKGFGVFLLLTMQ